MKKVLVLLSLLFLSMTGWSQELASAKNYDFALILEKNKNEDPMFTATNFYTEVNKNTILSFVSHVEFPLIEEKEIWKFGEVREANAPIINLDTFYESIPKFTNFSPYAQKHLDDLRGKMKILKGYDFCGRPVY